METTVENSEKGKGRVRYSIDGRRFSGPKKQKAKQILKQAGLDPDCYDLARLGCDGDEPESFNDNDIVCIAPGDRYVSVRERATVA